MRGWRLMLAACALAIAGAATAHARTLVVGGADAPAGSWPALVALVQAGQTPFNGQFCGGTLVDAQVVLTAGHCVTNAKGGVVAANSITVVAGLSSLSQTAGSQTRTLTAIKRHPAFNRLTLENDVAMLHLSSPIAPSSTPPVATMDLVAPTDRAQWEAGDAAQIAGWGLISPPPNPVSIDALQQATVQIVADASCASGASYGAGFVPAVMVCAGFFASGGVDACNGDSGGPLAVTGLNGAKVLVGATSFTASANPCGAPSFPAVYTRLDALRSFVYGAQGITGVSAPGAPAQVAASLSPGGATVAWSAPVSDGGRAIAGYRVTTRISGNTTPITTTDLPASAGQAPIAGLACGPTYTFTVRGANARDLGPESAQSNPIATGGAPVNTTPPLATGTRAVGQALTASTGQWLSCPQITFTYQWQRETARGSGAFAPIPGAMGATYVSTVADVHSRLVAIVTATNAFGSMTMPSNAIPGLPPFRVTSLRSPKVTLTSSGLATVGLRLHTEPHARLVIRVIDRRGALRSPIAKSSRIAGHTPRVVAHRLIAAVGARAANTVTIAFRGRSGGTLQTVRIVIVATNGHGERAETTVRARVRL